MTRSIGIALLFATILVPVVACEVHTGYGYGGQPQYAATVEAPPPTAQVNVQVDPNAQGQVDPNAQAQVDPNAQQADPNDQDPSAINDFRDALTPYGQWMEDPNYGTVWMPNPAVVGGDFTPYQTAGHWVYDSDYTWVSDYDWGWAPFHYGRWFQYPGRGWAWVPGKEYAGAWVTWRNSDDASVGAVGWAPTAPAYYWRGGQAVTITQPWYTPQYTYVVSSDLFAPTIRERIIRDPVRIRGYEARTRVYAPSGGYVAGSGGVRMRVRGPEPTRVGINANAIARPAANDPRLERARNFARTSNVRPEVRPNGGGNTQIGRTVTPTHPPIDTNRNPPQQQGHVEHTQVQGHVEPPVQQGHVEHTQVQGHVEPPVQHQVPPPAATQSQRPQVRPPPVQQQQRGGGRTR